MSKSTKNALTRSGDYSDDKLNITLVVGSEIYSIFYTALYYD